MLERYSILYDISLNHISIKIWRLSTAIWNCPPPPIMEGTTHVQQTIHLGIYVTFSAVTRRCNVDRKKSCTSWHGIKYPITLKSFIHVRWLLGISSINSTFSVLFLSKPQIHRPSFGPGSMRTLWLWESNLQIWHSENQTFTTWDQGQLQHDSCRPSRCLKVVRWVQPPTSNFDHRYWYILRGGSI